MGQLYLIRHGQASFGSENYDALSTLGTEQARLLGEWFARRQQRFDRVIVGAMQRHRQTAEACIKAMPSSLHEGAQWQVDARFNEYDHEEMLARHRPDAASLQGTDADARRAWQQAFEAALARWMGGAHDADYREPWPAFRGRCVAALQNVLDTAGRSQSIAVFTSGGTITTLCQHLLGLSDEKTAALNGSLVNAAVTRVLYRPGAVSLSYFNNFSHLESADRSGLVTYR